MPLTSLPPAPSSPTSTWQYRIGFLKPVSSSISSTRPVTSGPVTGSGRWTPSTSKPIRTNAASSSSTEMPAGRATSSASQLTGTFTQSPRCSAARSLRSSLVPRCDARSLLHSERRGEPDVALDDVAHVADAGAELQGALDAHAEREAGVFLRVDAAGGQHPRVDHPAAAPLDPLRTVAVLGEPHVELRGRLGEREEVRPPPGAGVGAEQRAGEVVQRAAQVGHGQAAVD